MELAEYHGKSEVAEVLCKHGARGALWYAAKNNLGDMVAELISKGHDLEECDKNRRTALQLAAEGKHGEVVGVLIGAGMAAGQWQDVNACLGSVVCVYVCMCAGVYVGSEGGM